MSEKVLSNMWIYSDEKGAFEKGYAEVWEGISGSRKAREKKGMRRREVQEQFYFRIMELPCAFNVGKKERQKRRGENGPLALKDFVRDYQKKKKKKLSQCRKKGSISFRGRIKGVKVHYPVVSTCQHIYCFNQQVVFLRLRSVSHGHLALFAPKN